MIDGVGSMRATARALPLVAALALAAGCASHGVQRPDLSFEPPIGRPAWGVGEGPVVLVDEAHDNFHTVDGRYAAFAKLLRRDGYVVQAFAERAGAEWLSRGDVYVVANATTEDDKWKLPTPPAFAAEEIEAIRAWVEAGGALLLIADHMPMPGAVEELAAAFDLMFHNGFLYDAEGESHLEFTRDRGLAEHPITEGRDASERVDSVRTFTGQAFRATREIEPLLIAPDGSRVRLPIEAWEFKKTTPSIPADGLLQGAVLRYGAGRVAVFGEAAMFSAQEIVHKGERRLAGMNEERAKQNPQFLLNVMHWLAGLL